MSYQICPKTTSLFTYAETAKDVLENLIVDGLLFDAGEGLTCGS